MIIDLELKETSLGLRHTVKSVDGRTSGGIVEFCSWGRLADEFVERSRDAKAVTQIKVDADGLAFYLDLR